jgi:hypothetical protein
MPEAATIFTAAEEATILHWVQQGVVTPDQVRAKVQIVIEERRSYDPEATRMALRTDAPQMTLYIDTVTHTPAATADKVMRWLTAGNR